MANNGILDPKEATPKGEAAAKKALELDGGLAEAHYAVARKLSTWTGLGPNKSLCGQLS